MPWTFINSCFRLWIRSGRASVAVRSFLQRNSLRRECHRDLSGYRRLTFWRGLFVLLTWHRCLAGASPLLFGLPAVTKRAGWAPLFLSIHFLVTYQRSTDRNAGTGAGTELLLERVLDIALLSLLGLACVLWCFLCVLITLMY